MLQANPLLAATANYLTGPSDREYNAHRTTPTVVALPHAVTPRHGVAGGKNFLATSNRASFLAPNHGVINRIHSRVRALHKDSLSFQQLFSSFTNYRIRVLAFRTAAEVRTGNKIADVWSLLSSLGSSDTLLTHLVGEEVERERKTDEGKCQIGLNLYVELSSLRHGRSSKSSRKPSVVHTEFTQALCKSWARHMPVHYIGRISNGSNLHTAGHVGGHSDVNLLWVRQPKVFHELSKLLRRLGQPRVEHPLLQHRGGTPVLVIMTRADQRLVRESENLLVHAGMERKGVSLLEVRSATATNQQGVAGECKGGCLGPQDVRHAAVGVARGGADLQREVAEGHLLPVLNVDVRLGPRGLGDDGLDAGEVFANRTSRGHVVRMAVPGPAKEHTTCGHM